MLGNEHGQLTVVSVEEHSGASDHKSISGKIGLNRDKSIPCRKVLNWSMVHYNVRSS